MAETVDAVNKALFDKADCGDSYMDRGIFQTSLFVTKDKYECASLETASVISVCDLPEGARISNIKLYFEDLGSGVTLDVGTPTNDDLFIAAVDVSSAGVKEMDLIGGSDYVIGTNDGDESLIITSAGVCTGWIKIEVYFTM